MPVKLIVGLGNPGPKYRQTRHNIGFATLDELAARFGASFESAPAEAMMARVRRFAEPVLLAKPLTFMNLSGHAVGDLARYFRVEFGDIFVIADDANLPLGRLRARGRGSDGGHNGLKSIIAQLGTQEFSRLRIGVGRGHQERDLADHVLSRFDPVEQEEIAAAIARAADATEVFITDGIEQVMNRFNGVSGTTAEPEDMA